MVQEAKVPVEKIFRWICDLSVAEAFSEGISDLLERYNKDLGGICPDDIDPRSQVGQGLQRRIDTYFQQCDEIGHTPFLRRLPTDSDIIVSYFRALRSDPPEVKARKALLRHINELKENLHKLSPNGFEEFCASLLRLTSFNVKTTPRTHDRGIDILSFQATCSTSLTTFEPVSRYFNYSFSLQSQVKKLSPKRVLPPDSLRALIGSVIGLKKTVPVLFCLGRFSSESWIFGRENGVILFDGQLLIEYAVDLYVNSALALDSWGEEDASPNSLFSWVFSKS